MPADAQLEPIAPKANRRWLQFSLRTMLGLTAVAAAGMGLWVNSAERQRRAVAFVRDLGGEVYYEADPIEPDAVPYAEDPYSDSAQDRPWFRRLLGDDYFKSVRSVEFRQSQVSDAALEHLNGISRLKSLELAETQITNDGLAHLAGLTELESLHLDGTQVTDEGLAHLQGLTGLQTLSIYNTRITDAGLGHLKKNTKLLFLYLNGTRVTNKGIAELRAALPNCDIEDNVPRFVY